MNVPGQPLTRRRFLGGLLLVGIAVVPQGAARFLSAPGHDDDPTERAAERLVALFADPSDVAPLGTAHLRRRADRPTPRQLLAEVLPPGMTETDVVTASDQDLRRAIRRWTATDLAAGRIEEVDGWLLSQTEVRLAALVSVAA